MDEIEQIRAMDSRNMVFRPYGPHDFESGMSALTAGIGAIHASANLSDEDLSRLNKQLTRLQMVVSLKFQERK